MTNRELVNELCRSIRGIALNYPDGMEQIRRTVDHEMRPRFEPPANVVPEPTIAPRWEATATHSEPVATLTLAPPTEPKRKPGRPKGSTNRKAAP